jgi:integrase
MKNQITNPNKEPQITYLPLTDSKTYNSLLKDFNHFLDGRVLSFEIIKSYLHYCKKERKLKPSTLGCIKAAIKKSLLTSLGSTGRDILFIATLEKEFQQLRTGSRDPRIDRVQLLSKSEVEQLIEAATPRISLVIDQTLAKSGLRISELTGITLKDCTVNKKKGIVFVTIIGKRDYQRTIYLELDLYKRIRNEFKNSKIYHFETYNENRFRIQYLYSMIRKTSEKVLERPCTPHQLRHFFANYMINVKQLGMKSVSLYLGHKNLQTTISHYSHDSMNPYDIFNAWQDKDKEEKK